MFKTNALLALLLAAGLCQAATNQPMRDPTQPLSFSINSKPSGPVLQSVLISSSRKVAIINGESLREGDTLAGLKNTSVQKIEANQVVLSGPEGLQTIKLIAAPGFVRSR